MLHQFILYLHYELDCLFYRQPKYDVRSEVNRFDKSRLKAEVKKLSKQIQKKYLSLNKKNSEENIKIIKKIYYNRPTKMIYII